LAGLESGEERLSFVKVRPGSSTLHQRSVRPSKNSTSSPAAHARNDQHTARFSESNGPVAITPHHIISPATPPQPTP
jgi:hypothetical protein